MSLLPSHVPPPNEPIGTTESGERVILAKNFWLFLYNVAKNSLSGVPDQFLEQFGIANDVSGNTDSINNTLAILNLSKRMGFPQDPVAIPRQFIPIQDPVARAQPVQTITVGASPYTYTAPFNGIVVSTGGTVSSIAVVRQGTSVPTGLTAGIVPLSRGDQLVITYSGTPTMTFLPS